MYFILDGLLHEDFSNRWTFEFIPFFSFRTDILLVGDIVFPSQMASQTVIVGKMIFSCSFRQERMKIDQEGKTSNFPARDLDKG